MKGLEIDRPKLDDQEARDLVAFLYAALATLRAMRSRAALQRQAVSPPPGGGGRAAPMGRRSVLKQFTSPIFIARHCGTTSTDGDAMRGPSIERPTFTGQGFAT
jgi:hypothetical protein